MSVKMSGLVWDSNLPRDQKFILLAYVDHASHDGSNIYPAVATIMRKTGYSERSVQRITAELVEHGYLVEDGHGPHGTNKWRVGIAKLEGAKTAGVPKEAAGGAKNDAQIAPDSLFKPSDNLYITCHFCHLDSPADDVELVDLQGQPVPRCEACGILGVAEPLPEKQVRRTAAETKASLERTADRSMSGKFSELPDFADYPEGLRPVLQSFSTLFGIEPGSAKGVKALWIEGARELQEACGEFGSAALLAYRAQHLEKTIKAGGIPPFDIKSPRSLVTSAASIARGFRDAGFSNLDKAVLIDEYTERIEYLQSARSRTDAPEGV